MADKHSSDYVLSIARKDGGTVYLRPGGIAERDLVNDIVDEVDKSYTGVFITQARVLELVKQAIESVLLRAKSDVIPRKPEV